MSETIIATIITGVVTLIGIVASSISTRNKVSAEMDKKLAVIEAKMEVLSGKVEEHNGYAKMFSETIPAIKQHMVDIDRRLEMIERYDK